MNLTCFAEDDAGPQWPARLQLMTHLARRGHRVLVVVKRPSGPSMSRAEVVRLEDGLHLLRVPARPSGGLWQSLRASLTLRR